MERKQSDLIKIVILIVAAFISFSFLAKATASPSLHADAIASLERKHKNITRLTAAATAASVGVSMLPDDTATPIAENLADLTDYFLIALCAVYLEKYLLTMTGYASFGVLFPLSFILLAIWIKWKDPRFVHYAKKLIAFGIAIFLLIPVSVTISNTIEDTYQFSIEEAIENVENITDEITAETEAQNEVGSFLDNILDNASSAVGSVVSKVKEWLTMGEHVLNELLEALAVILVTSCIIPVVVLIFFLWLIQLFSNTNVPTPYPKRITITRKLLHRK